MRFFIALAFFFPLIVHAVGTSGYTGKVKDIVAFPKNYGHYSESEKGLLAIYIEGLPNGCGSGVNRVIVSVDHPIYQSVLSMALYAKASNIYVKVEYFNECTLRGDSWDLANFVLR